MAREYSRVSMWAAFISPSKVIYFWVKKSESYFDVRACKRLSMFSFSCCRSGSYSSCLNFRWLFGALLLLDLNELLSSFYCLLQEGVFKTSVNYYFLPGVNSVLKSSDFITLKDKEFKLLPWLGSLLGYNTGSYYFAYDVSITYYLGVIFPFVFFIVLCSSKIRSSTFSSSFILSLSNLLEYSKIYARNIFFISRLDFRFSFWLTDLFVDFQFCKTHAFNDVMILLCI